MGSLRTISFMVLVILGLLVTLILAEEHSLIPLKANCSSSQFQCTNGGCIRLDDVCDCFNQCGDGSDEVDCNDMFGAGRDRSGYAYYCPGGGCIQYFEICYRSGGGDHCDDRSDEKNCSDVAPCSKLQFECSNGKCINPYRQCDGLQDCGDGSDEINCFGKCAHFECNNGKCVYESRVCDCKDDCGDGSDENNCSDRTYHCPNGTCLLNSDVCNCENDCGDGADEENCDGSTFYCPNESCILSSKICNCLDDCSDGTDEENCENECQKTNVLVGDFRFLCNHSDRELLDFYLNDDFDDCGDGADENYCADEPFICGIEGCFQNNSICQNKYGCKNRTDEDSCIGSCQEFQCPGGGPCIHKNKICDCNDDCGDGADEKNCRKGAYTRSFRYKPTLESYRAYSYHCGNGQCLSSGSTDDRWSCDSSPHCTDWSDEMECYGNCRGFQCPSGRCINDNVQCDGINDCGDWTDEKNCPDVACKEYEFQCTSGQCIHENYVCSGSEKGWCRDGSDEEKCYTETRFDGPSANTFSNDQCDVIDYDSGMSLSQCLSWCEADPACTAVNFNEEFKGGGCVRRACTFPVPRPLGNEHDRSWKGYSRKPVCTDGSTYQTNNASSICTCINGKYECKEKGCIQSSAIILEDGCNYCICNNGTYEFCTERTCKSNELTNINELSTEGSTHLVIEGELEEGP